MGFLSYCRSNELYEFRWQKEERKKLSMLTWSSDSCRDKSKELLLAELDSVWPPWPLSESRIEVTILVDIALFVATFGSSILLSLESFIEDSSFFVLVILLQILLEGINLPTCQECFFRLFSILSKTIQSKIWSLKWNCMFYREKLLLQPHSHFDTNFLRFVSSYSHSLAKKLNETNKLLYDV